MPASGEFCHRLRRRKPPTPAASDCLRSDIRPSCRRGTPSRAPIYLPGLRRAQRRCPARLAECRGMCLTRAGAVAAWPNANVKFNGTNNPTRLNPCAEQPRHASPRATSMAVEWTAHTTPCCPVMRARAVRFFRLADTTRHCNSDRTYDRAAWLRSHNKHFPRSVELSILCVNLWFDPVATRSLDFSRPKQRFYWWRGSRILISRVPLLWRFSLLRHVKVTGN
jgi:hypothetical protein